MYHELVYHLDLCMLTYHLHAQTLIWPLDPYMEQVATGMTDRRDTFMQETHAYFDPSKGGYRGPGAAAGWPSNVLLDPLITRYQRLYPWRPVFLGPEREQWLWHNSPTAITSRVREVFMASYPLNIDPFDYMDPLRARTLPPLPGPRSIATQPAPTAGTDRLYGFEGATGSILGSAGSWSFMGYCLAVAKGGGPYDVHIAFRGSRSGALGRAAVAGLNSGTRAVFALRTRDQSGERHWGVPGTHKHVARGNGDWVTDMDAFQTVDDPEISAYGSASRGFSITVKSCIPNIKTCLAAIHTAFGRAPDSISVTGHSLGGALAAQFSSAMICGTVHGPNGEKLPAPLNTWPWSRLRAITMSSPIVGGERFYSTFNGKVFTRRVMLGGDPVTNQTRHYHVGSRVHLSTTADSSDGSSHELFNVRRSLLTHATSWKDDLTGVPLPYMVKHPREPWIAYKSFYQMMQDQDGVAGQDLIAILAGYPAEFKRYLEILRATMTQSVAYAPGHGPRPLDPRSPRLPTTERDSVDRKISAAIALLDAAPVVNDNLDAWANCLAGIGGDKFQKYTSLAMILAARVKGMTAGGRPVDVKTELETRHLKEI
ncbi:MAG TPA: hypothetical protein VGK48_02545 [Terriglobia bacterium]|jgi:hypothetical protein